MPPPSRKNKYRNNRGGNRSKSIKRIGKSIGNSIGNSISGVATYAFNRLTQSKNPVQPIGSSLEIINNPPLRLLTLGTKSKKRQPLGKPPTIGEDSKKSVIDITPTEKKNETNFL